MWFLFALISLLSWGGADLFYKSSTDSADKNSHLKISVSVGLVMGVGSILLLIFTDARFSFINIVKYLPASSMYILSMIIGYAGMRYLELSVISPVQNSSGALSAVVMTLWFVLRGNSEMIFEEFDSLSIIGTVLICAGMVALAVVERKMSNPHLPENSRYAKGAKALIFPLLYCLFDTLGTAVDGVILTDESLVDMTETDILVAYGLTFLLVGIVAWVWMAVRKKEYFNPFKAPKTLVAAGCETFGQVFYIYAMAGNAVLSAPIIGSYCIVSVILSRIVIKEKLTVKQYVTIFAVIAGIVLMGISEGLSEM